MDGSRREPEALRSAWEALQTALHGERPLHVTELAAACLRAVDAAALNELLSSRDQCGRFRRIRDDANEVLAAAGGAKNTGYPDTLAALAAILRRYEIADDAAPNERSLGARALAQALHESRESHFWSYFSDWTEERKLSAGDPVPVPSSPKLYEIYRRPLRLSPCPDTRDTPHGLCPGGYRGLPSLRLAPACSEGDLYLDPLLGHDLCPLVTGNSASGATAIVVPAEDLDQRYEYTPVSLDDGERVFHRVRPRGSIAEVGQLIDGIVANLERAGDHAALAVLPELTSTAALEDAIGALAGTAARTDTETENLAPAPPMAPPMTRKVLVFVDQSSSIAATQYELWKQSAAFKSSRAFLAYLEQASGTAGWTAREQRVDEIIDRVAAAPIEGPADRGARDALSWLVAGEAAAALSERSNQECTDTEDGIAISDSDGARRPGCALAFRSSRRVQDRAISMTGYC